jgi:hypothetical protein
MTGSMAGSTRTLATRDSLFRAIVVGCLLAVTAGTLPAAAADETTAPSGDALAGEVRVPYEYFTSLIMWDDVDGTYRAGVDEGSFTDLLGLPEETGWELMTVLAESWTETKVADTAAWDVFRWRALYRRPLESSTDPLE